MIQDNRAARRRILAVSLSAMALLGFEARNVTMAAAPAPAPVNPQPATSPSKLFGRDNLIAWCIVPFDSQKRAPEARAEMLQKLGFKHFAYDWRAEHVPTFDAEIDALKKRGVSLDAFWVAPGELNRESRLILDVLKSHDVHAQLWVLLDLGGDNATGDEQERRIKLAAEKLKPLATEAAKAGCTLGLYNHGGWFGEPENQIAILERLKKEGVDNIGIVYNLHHGHEHLDRFPALLKTMLPYLQALNLNGMDTSGDKTGRKILPLGQGEHDLKLLKIILESGYQGPIGILGHTQDDAEERLRDNLDGLDWLLPQLEGKPAPPRPKPRTPVPPAAVGTNQFDGKRVADLVVEAVAHGDPRRGAAIFADPKVACLNCHKIGDQGGIVGPELSRVGFEMTPEQLAESLLWPSLIVKPGFEAVTVAHVNGTLIQGYPVSKSEKELTLRKASSSEVMTIASEDIEEISKPGTLMPDGLMANLNSEEQRDLLRFLIDVGRSKETYSDLLKLIAHPHGPATFTYDRKPLRPEFNSLWQHFVNRERLYDFYAKEADAFSKAEVVPSLLPQFPGLDGGVNGHWGNQSDATWADDRWNATDLGVALSGIFRAGDLVVPKGVCVRLGDNGEMAACFNPLTLQYDAVWQGGFVKFSSVRHGFMDGLLIQGTLVATEKTPKVDKPFVYHGFYRHGKRLIFSYRVGDVEMLDAPWVENGKFARNEGPAEGHPFAKLIQGGPSNWPQVLKTKVTLGANRPYAVDTFEPPFENPWIALMFFGDLGFLDDGTALLCTMVGDVWRVEGLTEGEAPPRWRRVASGLHQPLGMLVIEGKPHILGRDQITRLHDLNNDGEYDFYECVTNAYVTSAAGHDFICGLERDKDGNFITVSGKQGLIRIDPKSSKVEVIATGFRNADGVALTPDGAITVPTSEGEWVPASMVNEVRGKGHFGHGGPRNGLTPDLPLVYLPRGLDNSSGSQVAVTSDRWGPLKGKMVHLSYGTGTYFLLLRDEVDGQPQGAVVPMPGEFLSGAHRGKFNPKDGQLYVAGMGGWGTYTPSDGCFQRVRYTGDPVVLPVQTHAYQNGLLVEFSGPVDRSIASEVKNHFAQVWNYRYSQSYGSPEFSTKHPGTPGHDPMPIRSVTVLDDGKTLFLEMPDIQPVNQLHLRMKVDGGPANDLFATIHKLAAPFHGVPGLAKVSKTISAHPMLADLAALTMKPAPNPWRPKIANSREIKIEAGKNLSFIPNSFKVKAGEPIKLTFLNPDVVPHNWALIQKGSLSKVGDMVNKIIGQPDAVIRQYVPRSDLIICHTDIVGPQEQMSISFQAPKSPGKYPFLCTFPGHWMVMNGVMIVE